MNKLLDILMGSERSRTKLTSWIIGSLGGVLLWMQNSGVSPESVEAFKDNLTGVITVLLGLGLNFLRSAVTKS